MITVTIKAAEKVNGDFSAFISFPYDANLISIIRDQPARFWHAEIKQWEIPVAKLVPFLNQTGRRDVTITGEQTLKMNPITSELNGFRFKTDPLNHQIEGLDYGLKKDCFLLGDEQGLGKTKQSIDIAVARKLRDGMSRCLVICGVNGIKWNWVNEIAKHSDEKVYVLGTRYTKRDHKAFIGSNQDRLDDLNNLPDALFIVTNVETLRYTQRVTNLDTGKTKEFFPIAEKLHEMCDLDEIGMVVIDEIHKCKDPSSLQGEAIQALTSKVRIAMTGTPLMNTPLDLYIVLRWLGFERHSFYQFRKHYCVFGGYGGNEIVGYRYLDELKESLDGLMLRRLKKDVLDLPEKFHTTEFVEMQPKQAKIYAEVRAALKDDIDKIKLSPNPLSQLIRLRQATGYTGILSTTVKVSAKLDRMVELVEELVANGEKAIIFSNWTEITNPAYERLKQYNPAIITGQTTNRMEEKERFMTDPNCKVIIGTIGAMGTGITLTAGNTVIFLDSPWNRALKEQAEDRAHRIGTTGNVNVITLVCKGTIDERVEQLIDRKGKMSDMLVDGTIDIGRSDVVDFLLD